MLHQHATEFLTSAEGFNSFLSLYAERNKIEISKFMLSCSLERKSDYSNETVKNGIYDFFSPCLESESTFEDYKKSVEETKKEGIDPIEYLLMNDGIFDFVDNLLTKSQSYVKRFCDELISAGHISYILMFGLDLYKLSLIYKSKNYYTLFEELLNLCVFKINGYTIAKICNQCKEYCCEKYRLDEPYCQPEDIVSQNLTLYIYEFICEKLLGIAVNDNLVTDHNDLKKCVCEVIPKFYTKNSAKITLAGWLLPLCALTGNQEFAYISKEYILPAFLNTTFGENVIYRNMVNFWFDYSQNLCMYAMNVLPIESDEGFSLDKWINHIREHNLAFTDVFKTPCKGFGSALADFLDSGKYNHISNNNTAAQDNAKDKANLFLNTFVHANSLANNNEISFGNLYLLSAIFLLADNCVERGVQKIVESFSAMDLHTNLYHTKNIRIALLMSYFKVEDFALKMVLYNLIKNESTRLYSKYLNTEYQNSRLLSTDLLIDVEAEMLGAVKLFVKQKYKQFSSVKGDDGLDLENKLEQIEEILTSIKEYAAPFYIKSAADYDVIINNNIKHFFRSLNLNCPCDDIYKCLNRDSKRQVMRYLREGELVFQALKQTSEMDSWQEDLDYTPALIEMTKALEYVGNLIYKETIKNVPTPEVWVSSKYKTQNRRNWLPKITLGSIAFMFNLDRNDYFDGSVDTNLNIFSVIDEEKIKKLDGKPNGLGDTFTDDVANNVSLLFETLKHIADKYRNLAAHSDPLDESDYNNCKALMLTGKHILWVMLYIVKDDIHFA